MDIWFRLYLKGWLTCRQMEIERAKEAARHAGNS